MSPPTKNFWFLLLILLPRVLNFLSFHHASVWGIFSGYYSLVLLCGSVSLSRVLLHVCFFFFNALSSIFFFLDIRSIIWEGGWSGQQRLFCLLFLLILLKPSSLPALFQRQLLSLDQHSCNTFAHH